jgi:hypothetical protein
MLNYCAVKVNIKYADYSGLEWPRGFQKVKVPKLHEKAEDGGEVVKLKHGPPLFPGSTHFC